MNIQNPILNTDSYKFGHYLQYPPGTRAISSYITTRGHSETAELVFFGLQMFLKEYLSKPFTAADIAEGETVAALHGQPFNRAGWEHILNAHGGYFPLQENELYGRDRRMIAGQIGAKGEVIDDLSVKAAFAYYDFQNVDSLKNAPDGSRLNDYTAPGALAKGNSLFNMRTDGLTTLAGLASDFNLFNLTGSIAYTGFRGMQVMVTGDVVQNRAAISRAKLLALDSNSLIKPGDLGWQARLDVGKSEIHKFGDWRFAVGYKHIETDAVLDIFTDSDFGLGGTDVKGYILEGEFGIYKDASIGVNWFSTDSIERAPFSVDVLQVNLNAKF